MTITSKELDKIQQKLFVQSRSYDENEAYVKGKNPDILGDIPQADPDNRVPVPLAKMAVEDMTGYAARPGDISVYYDNILVADEDEIKEDVYQENTTLWMALNDDHIELSELYQKMLTHGRSYELWWTSESDTPGLPIKPEWKRVDGNQVYIKWTDDLKPVKEAAFYFRKISSELEICDIYYPLYSERWEKTHGQGSTDWKRNEEFDTEYPYTVVPMIEFYGNVDKLPLFEAEKPIIDANDKLLSNSVNEIDRFNALIALFPGKVDKAFKEKVIEMNLMDDLAQWDRWPEYLEKNLSGASDFYNTLADRLERNFHKSVKIPDMSDEQFAGNQSGIALAFKLLGMEFKASLIETYFFQGIMERKQLIDDIFNSASVSGVDTTKYKTVINAQRNLPVDELTKVQIAMQLKGIVSDETLLRFLPNTIVKDVEKELEKMEMQKANNPLLNAMVPDEDDEGDEV